MNHFTDQDGYNGIRAAPEWRFIAGQPPGNHPFGAYFTTLSPHAPNLCQRLGIPRRKTEFLFSFEGTDGLKALPGGRGEYVFYSDDDYVVARERQTFHGRSEDAES